MDRRHFLKSGGLLAAGGASATVKPRRGMNDVFILAGQSNMMGGNKTASGGSQYGNWPGWPTYSNPTKIFMLPQPWNPLTPTTASPTGLPTSMPPWVADSTHPVTQPGDGTWVQASDPLHSLPGAGVGPGMAFADRYYTIKNNWMLKIGLVPCAWSGTSIDDWHPSYHLGTPYGCMIARAQAAKAWGKIKGLLWWQGEQNYTDTDLYPNYIDKLYNIFNKFRSEIGMLDLPIIIVRLPGTGSFSQMQDTMVGVSPRLAVVSPSDTTVVASGNPHLTVAAEITLGHQLADAMAAMQLTLDAPP